MSFANVDAAITRLQKIAMSLTSVEMNAAPLHPVEDASVNPFAIAHIISGTGQADNASMTRFLPVIAVDFHFSAERLAWAYQQTDKLIPEYIQRLAGDPTLDRSVQTIVFPVDFFVAGFEWNNLDTIMTRFSIQLKFLETPTATST